MNMAIAVIDARMLLESSTEPADTAHIQIPQIKNRNAVIPKSILSVSIEVSG